MSYKLVIKLLTGSDPEVSDDANDTEEPMHQPFVNISHSGKKTNNILMSFFPKTPKPQNPKTPNSNFFHLMSDVV